MLFVAVTAYALLGIQPAMDPLLGAVRWLLAALFVVAIVASVFFAKSKDCDLGAFIAQSGAAALLVLLLAASMFPNFVVASADSVGPAITADVSKRQTIPSAIPNRIEAENKMARMPHTRAPTALPLDCGGTG